MSTQPNPNQYFKMKKKAISEEELREKLMQHQTRLREKYLSTYRFLKKKHLRLKYARVVDQSVEYCRVDELDKILQSHKEYINQLLKSETGIDDLKKDLVYLSRPLNAPNLRYPQILQFSQTPTQFASFPFNTEQSRKGLMIGIIVAILALVLFPIWPYELKYAVWLISLYLLIFFVSLLVVRLVIYSVASLFGVSLWLFPNLMSDRNFFESFKPTWSLERWERNTLTFLLRIFIVGVFVYYAVVFYNDPTIIQENINITKEAVKDIHDWGVKKIKGERNLSRPAIASIQEIINKTSDQSEVTQSKTEEATESTETTGTSGQPEQKAPEAAAPSEAAEPTAQPAAQTATADSGL